MIVYNTSSAVVRGGYDGREYVFKPNSFRDIKDEDAANHLVETCTLEGVKVLSFDKPAAEAPSAEAPAEQKTEEAPKKSKKA